jgi:hypothetical protein
MGYQGYLQWSSQLFYACVCVSIFIVTSVQFNHTVSSYNSIGNSRNLEPTANYSSLIRWWNFLHYVYSTGTWSNRTKIHVAEALDPTYMNEKLEQIQGVVTLLFTSARIYLPMLAIPGLGTTAHLFTGDCSLKILNYNIGSLFYLPTITCHFVSHHCTNVAHSNTPRVAQEQLKVINYCYQIQ